MKTKDGLSTNFNSDGFIKPETINMISNGKFSESLTSPDRLLSIQLITIIVHPVSSSIDMSPGNISEHDILSTINSGITK